MTGQGILAAHRQLARYLANFRPQYPCIEKWFLKVTSEALMGRRGIHVLWDGFTVGGLAITKRGRHGKLCHISVRPDLWRWRLGTELMSAALVDLAETGAEDVCVTTGEVVFRTHGPFFRKSGFEVIDHQPNRYIAGSSELVWIRPTRSGRIQPGLSRGVVTDMTPFPGTGLQIAPASQPSVQA